MSDQTGFVYFIQAGDGPIKIGWSVENVEKRLAMLQTGSWEDLRVLATMPATQDQERSFHVRFQESRIRGEWFHASAVLDYLEDRAREPRSEINFQRPPYWKYLILGRIYPSKFKGYDTLKCRFCLGRFPVSSEMYIIGRHDTNDDFLACGKCVMRHRTGDGSFGADMQPRGKPGRPRKERRRVTAKPKPEPRPEPQPKPCSFRAALDAFRATP